MNLRGAFAALIFAIVPMFQPRGVYCGRHRTRDGAMRKPFVVDCPAPMLKKNAQLSKHARTLYMTLRALADGITGELRINGHWLKATVFDRAAEMCRDIRMAAMRELIALGLVTVKRPRVWRVLGGRMRSVLAEAQYTVHREPVLKNLQKPKDSSKVDLQQSISSTVEEIDSQYVPVTPKPYAAGGVSGLPLEIAPGGMRGHHHHHHKPADDDDDRKPLSSLREKHVNVNGPVDERSESDRGEPAKAGATRSQTEKNGVPPKLRSWMDSIIVGRAQDRVRSVSAYLRASRPAFLENMAEEIEMFLIDEAANFMHLRIDEGKDSGGNFEKVCKFLHERVTKYDFPVPPPGDERYEFNVRIFDAACEILNLGNYETEE